MALGMLSWSMAKVQDMIFIVEETATSPDTSETFQKHVQQAPLDAKHAIVESCQNPWPQHIHGKHKLLMALPWSGRGRQDTC